MSLVGLLHTVMDKNLARKAAIKAIHCYPQNLEPWSVLLTAALPEDQAKRALQNAQAVMPLSDNQPLQQWLQQHAK